LNNQGSIVLDIPGNQFNSNGKISTIEEDIDLVNMMGNIPNKDLNNNNYLSVPMRSFGRRQTMDLSIIKEPSFVADSKTNLDITNGIKRKGSFLSPTGGGLLGIPEGPSAAERSFNMANAINQFNN
jgi:hypothetical protein